MNRYVYSTNFQLLHRVVSLFDTIRKYRPFILDAKAMLTNLSFTANVLVQHWIIPLAFILRCFKKKKKKSEVFYDYQLNRCSDNLLKLLSSFFMFV